LTHVSTGLDVFKVSHLTKLKGARLGLLSNQASVDSALEPACDVISKVLPGQLRALFGPQHGYHGEDQDNMVETGHTHDPRLKVPVFSLYAEQREPLPDMVSDLDVLIVDLQDVGTRVYTFSSTMLNCMRVLSGSGCKVLVLDRPNPIGGILVEGNLLREELFSFVGPWRLPMRHGLTMGELALLFKDVFKLDLDLEIIKMNGWERDMVWAETGLRWVMPSPNMPLPDTAHVYPGQVLWEGTNASEGRGTCRPFEIFGAPYMDPESILKRLPARAIQGAVLKPFSFRPTFHKWEGRICRGYVIYVTDYQKYEPYFLSIALLSILMDEAGDQFEWRKPPYEYEHDKQPIDLIIGDRELRKEIENKADPQEMRAGWQKEQAEFVALRKPYLLYP
jgi:uncharacterized protein YbbC (DUF1343 family)